MVTAELASLDGLGAFIGRLELRIHPFVAEESGAILGDAVAAHQTDRLPHHVGAVAGVPELGGRANDVGRSESSTMNLTIGSFASSSYRA